MDPAVREIIYRPRPSLQTMKDIAALLPADDAEVDRWIEEAVNNTDPKSFVFLLLAALGVKRPVDGKHLIRGMILITEPWILGCIAWHLQGDVPEHLVAATKHSELILPIRAVALFCAAAICQERRGGVLPPDLIMQARLVARHEGLNEMAQAALAAIASITKDPNLAAILKIKTEKQWEAAGRLVKTLATSYSKPPFEQVSAEPERHMGRGFTVRRAVEKIGRNDPCPCQSGRKYKNCCMAKDELRLADSSHIAGKSLTEIRAEPEPYLTYDRLDKTAPYEVLRFDPLKVPADLLEWFFFRLSCFSLFDRAIECFQLLGFPENLDESCDRYLLFAMREGRKDAIEKMVKAHPRPERLQESMVLGVKLIFAEDDPAKLVKTLEEGARTILDTDDPEKLQELAYSMLSSKFAATGIFVARAVLPSLNDSQAKFILKEVLIARDKMGLPPDDKASEILDQRYLEELEANQHDDSEESRALREVRGRLETKAREVQYLQRSMETLRQDVECREKAHNIVPNQPAKAAPSAVDEGVLDDLRFKIQELKGALKERYDERAALRRELQEAHAKLEVQPSASAEEPDPEEEHVLPEEPAASQPLRIPEFPRKFQETLADLPKHVARSAVAMAGRLASGELAAFAGVVRLKACPDVHRQRIGGDHRLLFRLQPDRLVVVDLINRRDLERRIKSLVAGG
jgi:hypothetical protein